MNYNKSFLITLGHNSSVIFYDCESKPIGYEEERLSKIKSDSSYPILAFEQVLKHLTNEQIQNSNVFISHWFDKFAIEDFPEKYFNHGHFSFLVEKYNLNVIPVSSVFTHHDAHAYSSKAFYENFLKPEPIIGDLHYIVADGFGNNQEVLSIYKEENDIPVLIKRVYGYKYSLGLLYQYATSYCGMKENQDEYKFLGYEVKIKELLTEDVIEEIRIYCYKFSMFYMQECININTEKPFTGSKIIAYNELEFIKSELHRSFDELYEKYCSKFLHNEEEKRILIGFIVQTCLEYTLERILEKYKIKNVILSGGCFLNVKLNKVILDKIPGIICVNPLAGDQGAAIGLFRKYTNTHFDYADLCFGKRDKLQVAQSTIEELSREEISIFSNERNFILYIVNELKRGKIVNVVQGNMEFGPRALCNTSTLALPTKENAEYINKVNKRNEVMPMAPVTKAKWVNLFNLFKNKNDLDRVIGSNEFMIITHDYDESFSDVKNHRGVLHTNLKGGFTCRPQLVHDSKNISEILSSIDELWLINTSFNTHGTPILFSYEDAIKDFRKQKELDVDNRMVLVMLNTTF